MASKDKQTPSLGEVKIFTSAFHAPHDLTPAVPVSPCICYSPHPSPSAPPLLVSTLVKICQSNPFLGAFELVVPSTFDILL